eukprot:CAMPEP_0195517806 /NCGR_PEP_ID=MMETSP0794_2-20130614/11725_1 /TAXON_ID=515487 /ORGANISM="Stephanopyxis turris, Strain CCMP 815" /LENGTH=256 /DNA_ID=CAMNT_0040646677 /DNA_START=71 /DNA_END=841 /DNA_ORIENTATION=+
MANLANAQSLLTELNSKVDAGDIEGGKNLLSQLKIAILDFPVESIDFVNITISALELGVLLSVADDGDMESFSRNLAQVKPYYSRTTSSTDRKCHILGLNLMHLLVENQLSEFHAELEKFTPSEASHKYIAYPIMLERQLMVGSYDEVLRATSEIPDGSYSYFVTSLMQTVRDNIADCLEVAYKTMSVESAVKMMRLESVKELMEYVEECRDDWIVEGGDMLCFQPAVGGSKASDVPSMKLISQSLSYATELERIV